MAESGSSGIGLFDLAQARLNWVDRRQQVLTQNIANADTPGYKPLDVTPFAQTLQSVLAPVQTNPAHLAGSAASSLSAKAGATADVAVDGNAVSVTDQLAKVADTSDTQALVENLYTKYMGFFMTALGKTS